MINLTDGSLNGSRRAYDHREGSVSPGPKEEIFLFGSLGGGDYRRIAGTLAAGVLEMKITIEQLRKLGACELQVLKFQELFGKSVEITRSLCIRHACKFDWNWVAVKFAAGDELMEFRRVIGRVHAKCNSTIDAARTEYLRSEPQLEFDKTTDPAWTTYNKILIHARLKYQTTIAKAFYGIIAQNHQS